MILAKLWQFRADDHARVVRLPGQGDLAPPQAGVVSSLVLFDGGGEQVRLETWRPGAHIELPNPDGLELLVITGAFEERGENLDRWCWLRLPATEPLIARVGSHGAQVWVKSSPLLHADVCAIEAEGSFVGANI